MTKVTLRKDSFLNHLGSRARSSKFCSYPRKKKEIAKDHGKFSTSLIALKIVNIIFFMN